MAYCTAQDLIAEGVPEEIANDARTASLIDLAGQYIELITRRWFEERAMTLKLDGTGHDTLWLPIPIIQVDSVISGGVKVPSQWLTVYNRRMPDDRKNPRIVNGYNGFPKGRQNIEVTGKFGYTDEGPNGTNVTPAAIKRACVMLVIRELPLLTDIEGQEDKKRARIQSETTDRHSYTLAQLASNGEWTGDPEIDNILYFYSKPPGVGSV